MAYKLLSPRTKETKCDFRESCKYHQEALFEVDNWMHVALKYKHDAIEWKGKAEQYEKILRMRTLLKEPNKTENRVIQTMYRLLRLETLELLLITSIAIFMTIRILPSVSQEIGTSLIVRDLIIVFIASTVLVFLSKYVEYYGD